jgi:hypothetical protein
MTEKRLLAKLVALELKDKNKGAQIRRLRQQNRDLTNSRASWKLKYQSSQAKLASLSGGSKIRYEFSEQAIEGHKYDLNMVHICLSLYFFAGCTLRGVKRVLLCLQLNYGYFCGDLPSKSSIDNWIQKVGYDHYTHLSKDTYIEDYSIIIDESMVVGQQRMMVALGLPAIKTDEKATNLPSVELLHVAVRAAWSSPDIVIFLDEITKKMGKPPLYVISDANSNLKKGIKDSGLVRICDVGHEIAKFVEQTYKDQAEFKAFSSAVAAIKFREIMKDTAYLLPPKQRSIARFMNLSHTIDWAANLLKAFPTLTQVEQQRFEFLKSYQNLIQEFVIVFEMIQQILKNIKNEGISYKNIHQCLDLIKQYTKIPASLITKITTYFKEELAKLTDENTVWHASSDIIESLFGKFKQKAASNKLNGVTPLVLSLGLYGEFEQPNLNTKDKIKNALQTVSMADLTTWKQTYLIQNQVVRRRNIFNF